MTWIMNDLISKKQVIEEIEGTDWYEIRNGKLMHGASREEEALYKATDIYKAIENVPPADLDRLSCDGCIYPYGMGINCDLCCRNYPDRYERKGN